MESLASVKNIFQQVVGNLTTKLTGLVLSVSLSLLLLFWMGTHIPKPIAVKETNDVVTMILSQIQDMEEFTTASTTSKATIVEKQVTQVFGITIGEANLVYEGVGDIRAGINLQDIQVKNLDTNNHKVHIVLPAPYISAIGLNVNRSSTLANYRNWFAFGGSDRELQEQAQRDSIQAIRKEACANHILEHAGANAKQLVEKILTKVGFEQIRVDIAKDSGNTCVMTEDVAKA